MTGLTEIFDAGEPKQPVTSVTLVNNTAKTVDTTVPAGKKWKFNSIKITNPDDVARTVDFLFYKEAAATNLILTLDATSVGAAGTLQFPRYAASASLHTFPVVHTLIAGNIIRVTWRAGGVSAGGTDADGLVTTYREVPA